jgi:hypothetical protein
METGNNPFLLPNFREWNPKIAWSYFPILEKRFVNLESKQLSSETMALTKLGTGPDNRLLATLKVLIRSIELGTLWWDMTY